MKRLRPGLAFLLLLAALLLLLAALAVVPLFNRSAGDYGKHHEVTVYLCRFLALTVLSLGAALTASRLAGAFDAREAWRPLGSMTIVALAAWIASLIFANEVFYSRHDYKGFPVHPTDVVLFPAAGWHGLPSHLLAALLMFFGFALLWWSLRRKKTQ